MEWYGILLLNLYFTFWMYKFYKLGRKKGYHKGWEENGQALVWNKRVYEERENKLESELDFERKRSEHWVKKWEEKNAKLGKMLDENTELEKELCELKEKEKYIIGIDYGKKDNVSYYDVLVEWENQYETINGLIFKDVVLYNGVGIIEFDIPIKNYGNIFKMYGFTSIEIEKTFHQSHVHFKVKLIR